MSKSTKFKKVLVILALVGFLLFTALSAVMYLAEPKPEIPVNLAIEECENAGGTWSEENQECEEQAVVIDSEQECQEQGKTRYAENGVCI
ncbi:MAG TPA: hypothetical protein P5155_01135 [Candidatus Absconditabacterales bacterium]|nr:hypothetical protein [Candidatus Absconditabacterales bacterium]